jgi:hypothetical protein
MTEKFMLILSEEYERLRDLQPNSMALRTARAQTYILTAKILEGGGYKVSWDYEPDERIQSKLPHATGNRRNERVRMLPSTLRRLTPDLIYELNSKHQGRKLGKIGLSLIDSTIRKYKVI